MVLPGSCAEACGACGMGHGQVSPPKKHRGSGAGRGPRGGTGGWMVPLEGSVTAAACVVTGGTRVSVRPSVHLSVLAVPREVTAPAATTTRPPRALPARMLPPWDSGDTAGGNGGLLVHVPASGSWLEPRVFIGSGWLLWGGGVGPWSPFPGVLRGTGFPPLSLGTRRVRGRVRVRPVGDPSVP